MHPIALRLALVVLLCGGAASLALAAEPSRTRPSALQRRALATRGPGSHWELTAFTGLYLPKDLYQAGGARLGLHDRNALGGRLSYHPSGKLGIELSYARTSGGLAVRSGETGFANPSPLGKLTVQQADLGVLLMQEEPPGAKTAGFLLAGAGATRFGSHIEGASGDLAQTRLAWHVGIGSKIKVSDLLALRLEARYRSTNTDGDGEVLYRDANENPYSFAPRWYRTGEVTAGLTYRMGG
jgi:opacity protein-like surface antigen